MEKLIKLINVYGQLLVSGELCTAPAALPASAAEGADGVARGPCKNIQCPSGGTAIGSLSQYHLG